MQGKDKNRNDQLSGFLRYHGNEMDDRERNAFEKSLQRDPFAEEASEGFAEIDPAVAETDITELRTRLVRKTSGKRRILWVRIAATLAAVMILTSIFTIDWRKKPAEQFTLTPPSPVVSESPVLREQSPEKAVMKDQMAVNSDKKVQSEARELKKIASKKEENRSEETPAVNQVVVAVAEVREAEPAMIAEKTTLSTTGHEGVSMRSVPVRGRIISSEDNQPLPGASITIKGTNLGAITDTGGNFRLDVNKTSDKVFVAQFIGMKPKEFKAGEETNLEIKLDPSLPELSEVVVVGYGVKDQEMEMAGKSSGYTLPQPVHGKADFDKYIRDNIKRPDNATSGQRVVVVLSFNVDKTGRPDSIKVVKSLDKAFSDEAIRLLREGPAWKPAMENGEIKRDEARIRIIFK
jgi:outer membrane biosynthesis protein TonB